MVCAVKTRAVKAIPAVQVAVPRTRVTLPEAPWLSIIAFSPICVVESVAPVAKETTFTSADAPATHPIVVSVPLVPLGQTGDVLGDEPVCVDARVVALTGSVPLSSVVGVT